MKKTFNIIVKQKDGSVVQKGVLAQEATGNKKPSLPDPCPPCLVAHIAALAAASDGSEIIGINFGTAVDIDTTV